MVNKKLPKKVRRQRVLKAEKKLHASYKKIVDIIVGKNMREHITLFKEEKEKPLSKKYAIGIILCPLCGKNRIFVANHSGVAGKPEDDYIMRHDGQDGYDCKGSLVPVKNLFRNNA